MNCKITGYEIKTLEVTLFPGETFYAERGSIVWVDEDLQYNVEFNHNTSKDKAGNILGGLLKSALSGESIFILRFHNYSTTLNKKIVLSGKCSSLIPIKLQDEKLICRRGCYVASTNKINLNINFKIQGLLGGMGAGFFQKIEGNATIFLDSVGAPLEKVLSVGEIIEANENNIIAFQGFNDKQIQAGWSFKNILGGNGVSLMRIIGPGKIYFSPIVLLQ